MAPVGPLRHSGAQKVANVSGMFKYIPRPTTRQARRTLQNTSMFRHASSSVNSAAAQYHIPKRAVHIGVPLLATIYLVLRFTDPSLAPQPPRKMMEDIQGTACKKIHASDLNKYIKSHPDEISDEHTFGWNKMFNSFKEHRKISSEPARIEEENARQLAQYARIEDNKYRSTKVPGSMATEGGNRNISHRPEVLDDIEETANTFSDSIAARVQEAKRRFTKAMKGRDFS